MNQKRFILGIGNLQLSQIRPHGLALILLRHADTKMKRGTKAMMENFSNISDKFYSNFFIKKPTLVPDVGNAMVQDRLDLGDNDDAG